MRIFLTGFMGSGKTTIGRTLAENMSLDFVDLDDVIEEQAGKSISEIFEESSEKVFREMERTALDKTMSMDNVIIATGGGTPCFGNNMERMNTKGLTVYLKLSADRLFDRLKDETEERPLIQGFSEDQLKNYITRNLQEREGCYRQAQFYVAVKDYSPEEIAEQISSQVVYFQK